MNNSEQLVNVINSVLGDNASKNILAIKVAQEVIERDFSLGQKLAEFVFGNKPSFVSNDQTLAEKIAYFKQEQEQYDRLIDEECDATKTRLYWEQHA